MIPNILLVDDEPAILYLLSHYLRESGYNVKEAACLAEAREAIQLQQFNAVILDLILPDGNGIDWITRSQESQSGCSYYRRHRCGRYSYSC